MTELILEGLEKTVKKAVKTLKITQDFAKNAALSLD
jgi:hypothetical protein